MNRLTILVLLTLLFPVRLWAQDNELCLSCHMDVDQDAPQINLPEFEKSIHGKNVCVSCHRDASEIPHPPKLAPVSCRMCHRLESQIYLQSDHGKAVSKGQVEAATCTSCHGETHTLLSSRDPRSPVNRKNIPHTCAGCHADNQKMLKFRLTEKEPFDTYMLSVHGQALREGKVNSAVCSDCHGTHDLHASSNPASKVFRYNILQTCSRCHENVKQVFDRSVHGVADKAGIKESPVCTDCHGEHTIRPIKSPASSVYAGAISKTCSGCHESERIIEKFGLPMDRLKTYQDSYHGLASRLGDLRAANCASCHGWHDVLASYDTRSSVNPKNLPTTCGKCHVGAKPQFFQSKIHGEARSSQYFWIRFFTLFYSIVIPLTIGFIVVHNTADYVRKTIAGRAVYEVYSGRELTVLRLNVPERIQHLFLIITFFVLAYSGFSLKYPDAWWATPFLQSGEVLRKAIHRWTALVFCLVGFGHLLYMIGTRRGRFILRHNLMPKFRDILDLIRFMAFNLGLGKKRVELRYPSYIERFEYWALIWGSCVMILTGSILVFNDFALRYLPVWVSSLATLVHFYEAVLAFLSILVWHFYWTIFDPAVYPMNMAWITGRLRKGSHSKG